MSWHPPKWEHPQSSVLGLFLEVEGDSFYTVTTEDAQAAFEQVWGTKQHDFFPSVTAPKTTAFAKSHGFNAWERIAEKGNQTLTKT